MYGIGPFILEKYYTGYLNLSTQMSGLEPEI